MSGPEHGASIGGVIAKLRPEVPDDPDAGWVDPDGLHWDTPGEALGHFFGFCGCGAPDAALSLMRDALRLVSWRGPEDWEAHRAWYRTVYEPHRKRLFGRGREDLMYFVWYALDNKELTDHGGQVPGWLTPLGHEILADLEQVCDPDDCIIPAAPAGSGHPTEDGHE